MKVPALAVASATLLFILGVDAGSYPVNVIKRNQEPSQPSCTNFTSFAYAGCFSDLSSPRALLFSGPSTSNMTVETCVAFCKGNDYKYAGLEYYKECFCGVSVNGPQVNESSCSFPCTGDKTETCGGNDFINIYQDTTFPTVDNTVISDYKPMGCYSEGSSGRSLAWRQNQINATTMTVESCLFACKGGGFSFAGVEFGQECYCGVVLGNGTLPLSSTSCNMPCAGNSSETCGGRSTLNLYVAKDLESTQPCNGGGLSSSSSSIVTSTTTSLGSSSSLPAAATSSSTSQTSFSTISIASSSAYPSSSSSSSTTSPYQISSTTSSSLPSTTDMGPWSQPQSSTSSSFPSTQPLSSTSSSLSSTQPLSSTSNSVSSSQAPFSTSTSLSPSQAPSSTSSSLSSSTPSSSSQVSPSSSSLYVSSSQSSNIQATSSSSPYPSSSTPSPQPPKSSISSSTPSLTSSSSRQLPTTSISPSPSSAAPSKSSTLYTSSKPATSSSISRPITSTKTSASLCTSTIVTSPTPTCEYKCGNWCSKPLPTFSDSTTCWTASSSCEVQLSACFLQAGFPGSLSCFDFSNWCTSVSTYCEGYCPGPDCHNNGCKSRHPPSGPAIPPPTTSISVYTCPAATSAKPSTTSTPKPSTTTFVPIPTNSNICTQPSSEWGGYDVDNPVGGIPLPCLTCNNHASDYNAGNCFKLYTDHNTQNCPSYSRSGDNGPVQGCKDACDSQYTSCLNTYAEGCKSKRSWGDTYNGDTYNSASQKCTNQWQDCHAVNSVVSVSPGRCGSFNTGWW